MPHSGRGCRDCPVACHAAGKGGGGGKKAAAYAALWSLDPDWPGLADLLAEYHRRCDDLGVEAFETAGAVAAALRAGAVAPGGEAILRAVEEIGRGTGLGLILGSGAAGAARRFGPAAVEAGPTKEVTGSPEAAAMMDTLGICAFAAAELPKRPEAARALADILKAKYGRPFSPAELLECGRRVLETEADFDEKTGQEEANVMSRVT